MNNYAFASMFVATVLSAACSDSNQYKVSSIESGSTTDQQPVVMNQQPVAPPAVAVTSSPSSGDSGFNPFLAGVIGYVVGSSFNSRPPQPVPSTTYVTSSNTPKVVETQKKYIYTTPSSSVKVNQAPAQAPNRSATQSVTPTVKYTPVAPTRSYSYTPTRSSFSSSSFSRGRR